MQQRNFAFFLKGGGEGYGADIVTQYKDPTQEKWVGSNSTQCKPQFYIW